MSRVNGGRYGRGRHRSVADMQPPMPASEEDDSFTDDPDQEEFEPEYPVRAGYGSGRYGRGGSGRSGYAYPEDGYPGGSVRSSNYPEVRYKNTYQPPSRQDAKDPEDEPKRRGAWGRCVSCLCCAWKVTRCLCSHITLVTIVVAYCLIGAFMFEKLEAGNEKTVKEGIVNLRTHAIDYLWEHTTNATFLEQTTWTATAQRTLEKFEADILKAMRKDGWDGSENTNELQWSFFGALFYSIIVITTIGYGHIAPKTQMGKVATILYAIAGIPLMLLCLSNIGDVMAQCFRFLYWRVCCFVCTRDPQPKRRSRSRSASSRGARQNTAHHAVHTLGHRWSATGVSGGAGISGGSTRSRIRASSMAPGRRFPSTRSADSAIQIDVSKSSHSDTECRFDRRNAFDDGDPFHYPTVPRQNNPNKYLKPYRSAGAVSGPVLSNKYALDREESFKIRRQQLRAQSVGREPRTPVYLRPGGSLPRHYRMRERPTPINQFPQQAHHDSARSKYSYGSGSGRRFEPPSFRNPSPRIMSPMGFAINRQYYPSQEHNSTWDVEMDGVPRHPNHTRPVPIWLCIFLVVSYIFGGAFLFTSWEGWQFLDSAYFCFITLTTIGFGDFVPAATARSSHQNDRGDQQTPQISLALCSLYLLFGISLLAMSFNLVQEEVLNSVRSVAKRLGIIKTDSSEEY